MTTPSMYLQEGGFSQRTQRNPGGQMFQDQFGREYHAEIELKTGATVGPIQPQFTAPLATPMKYLKRSTDRRRPYDLIIDFKEWLADLRTAWDERNAKGRQLGRAIYQDRYDPAAPFSAQILEELGPPPQLIDPVLAASQGNKYVLGLTTKVDVRLFAMLEEEQRATKPIEEPDYSEVVEFDALEEETAKDLDESRRREREKKARQRAKKKNPHGLGEIDDAA